MNGNGSVLREKSFTFAMRTVRLYRYLSADKKEYFLSKQILKSGTSIGANVREAQNAQSTADFVHKLSISQKECDETLYWLELLKATNFLTPREYQSIHQDAQELLKILRSSILTTKRKS